MPQGDRDKLNRIEELKVKLFSKNFNPKIEHRDSFSHSDKADVRESWEDESADLASSASFGERFFKKTSMFKNFFLFSALFFILAIGYGAYVFFVGGNTVSNENIDISILGNNFTAGGEDLPLVVGITNKNNSALDLVDLVVEYPKSSRNSEIDTSSSVERNRISLGTIPAGAVRNENLKVVLFGQQGSIVPIKISIEYRVEGSNAIFVKQKLYEVTINSAPINLSVDGPTSISPNQDIKLDIKVALNATRPATKILLKVDYPVGFAFASSTPSPSLGTNVWSLGDLAPGAERTVSITGKMIDVFDGEDKSFQIKSGLQSAADKSVIDVVFNSLTHTIAIKKPFIETTLSVNGASGREYAIDSKTPIHGEIRWVNNLDTKVNDLEIRAKISGNAVDERTINGGQGFYNSILDTITWDQNSVNTFSEVSPGDSGAVTFSLSPTTLFSSSGGTLADPSINIDISISGKQQLEGYATADINSFESSKIRIISDVGFAAKALYYSGPFKNTGAIPPKVEKETTYTIVWSVTNTANNISKATVRSSIPVWMRFVGPISPSSEGLTFNASTREITWNIGKIPKGTGIASAGKEVSFQVGLTPSLSQVGAMPVLINEAVLTGHDDFANVDVRGSKGALRSGLDNDPAFPPGGGFVSE